MAVSSSKTTWLLVAALIACFAPSAFGATDAVEGVWLSDDGRGATRIVRCGNSLCGRVVWLRDSAAADRGPVRDLHNPDPALRTRTICGLQVIGGLRRQADGSWDGGWVYDPKVGKKFDLAVSLTDKNTLAIVGYLGSKLFSETHEWHRADAHLPVCKD
jgi:uncharacterized protein (DUF2147 family)